MDKYDVIVVQVSTDEFRNAEVRRDEVERYIYGRYFFLGSRESNESSNRPGRAYVDLFFLVDSHYTSAIIPRLASGLLYGHVASEAERYEVGL